MRPHRQRQCSHEFAGVGKVEIGTHARAQQAKPDSHFPETGPAASIRRAARPRHNGRDRRSAASAMRRTRDSHQLRMRLRGFAPPVRDLASNSFHGGRTGDSDDVPQGDRRRRARSEELGETAPWPAKASQVRNRSRARHRCPAGRGHPPPAALFRDQPDRCHNADIMPSQPFPASKPAKSDLACRA